MNYKTLAGKDFHNLDAFALSEAASGGFRAIGSGKFMRRQANKSYLLQPKSSKRKNHLSKIPHVHENDAKNLRMMLPYYAYDRL